MSSLPVMEVFARVGGAIGVRLKTSDLREFNRIASLLAPSPRDEAYRLDIGSYETSFGPTLDLETLVRQFSPSFKLILTRE